MRNELFATLLAVGVGAAAGALAAPPDRGLATETTLPYAGVSLVQTGGRVEVREPDKAEFRAPPEMPLPLGVGMSLRTGTLSRALLEYDDGSSLSVGSHAELRFTSSLCRLEAGRIKALAAPRQIVGVQTGTVPVRVRGKLFSVAMAGKGRGKMAALGDGRPIAARLLAVKGFVEVQLPFGTVRATQLPLTLHQGSVVQTSANSYALIAFPDGTRLKLRADSTAAVDNENRGTIAAGAADVMVGDKNDFELRTINRPAFVRGPAFLVEVNPQGETAPPGDEPETPRALTVSTSTVLPGTAGWDVSGGR
ncbi:MAG: FecR domain-containing protein [Elusimicrobia bacterium]|nr:FecR domain-containing protein [Elusimicrobiota bacterium]